MPFLIILCAIWLSTPSGPHLLTPTPSGGRWYGPIEATGNLDNRGIPVAAKDGLEGTRAVSAELWLYVPKGLTLETLAGRPLVLALHGWNHSPKRFIEKSTLAEEADRHGFAVAIPDTGKTIFETALYGENRAKWDKFAGAPWVSDVILPLLRTRFGLGVEAAKTAVVGYSTGGRGAVFLAARYGGFAYVGSVSGTYDLMSLDDKTGEYKIHAVVYGKRSDAGKVGRWTEDNVTTEANLARLVLLPLYLAHGKKDKAVPIGQMDDFEKALAAARNKVAGAIEPVISRLAGDHDWPVWNAIWGPMFEGFAQTMKR